MAGWSKITVFSFVISAVLTAAIGVHLVKKSSPPEVVDTEPTPVQKRPPARVVTSEEFFASLSESGSEELAARVSLMEQLVALPDEDLPGVVEKTAAANTEKELNFATLAGLLRWTEVDPPAAFAWAAQLEWRQRSGAYREMGMIWAQKDAASYGTWIRKQVERMKQSGAKYVRVWLGYLSPYDLATAVEIGALIGDVTGLERSVYGLESVEEIRAVAAAIELLPQTDYSTLGGASDGSNPVHGASLPKNGDRRLRSSLALRWETLDPEGYAAAVAAGEFDPRSGGRSNESNLKEASEASEEAPTEAERREEIYSHVQSLVHKDLDAAGEWLGAQGEGPETWPARRLFARATAGVDLESALAWVDSIGAEDIRRGGFVDVVEAWVYKNPDAVPDMTGWSVRRQRVWDELSSAVWRDER